MVRVEVSKAFGNLRMPSGSDAPLDLLAHLQDDRREPLVRLLLAQDVEALPRGAGPRRSSRRTAA